MIGEHKSGSQSYPVVRQDDAIEGPGELERTAGELDSFRQIIIACAGDRAR